ncbi:uncharacterized protein [Ovis canadensis]|uniref:uncharacterized protein isoform X2 n=1 Tax=Ovis canadensis TaxID=37174 RepID=UPI003753C706
MLPKAHLTSHSRMSGSRNFCLLLGLFYFPRGQDSRIRKCPPQDLSEKHRGDFRRHCLAHIQGSNYNNNHYSNNNHHYYYSKKNDHDYYTSKRNNQGYYSNNDRN